MKKKKTENIGASCDICAYNSYNDEDCYECGANFDEDEYVRFMSSPKFECPYFNPFNEYKIVEKQN